MALPGIKIDQGIDIGGGIRIGTQGIYAGQTTTPGVQNVAGSDDPIGFFFVGSWSSLTGVPNLNDVRAGWLVTQIPGATVVSTDANAQTITITGGSFTSGSFYTFVGV
jgi:hypothetical protein